MVYAALLHSTIAHGRIASLDTAAAETAPGVVLVMTHKNAPRMKPPPVVMSAQKAAGNSDLPIMQDDSIHWNGEPVALVLAKTQEEADYAKSLIAVTYETKPAETSFSAAKTHARVPENVLGEPSVITIGDAEAALQNAAFKIDYTYRTPRYNHNAIELHAATVMWDGDRLIVHDAPGHWRKFSVLKKSKSKCYPLMSEAVLAARVYGHIKSWRLPPPSSAVCRCG